MRLKGLLALALAIGLVVVVSLVRTGDRRDLSAAGEPPPGLAGRITAFLATQYAEQPYRDPTDDEKRAAVAERYADLGFTTVEGVDEVTGRRYALHTSPADDRAWGAVLVDLSEPTRLAVEVPHPRTDIGTEWIGLDLFRAVPGSTLLIAGAHRRAAGELADVAHNEHSLYQALSVAFAKAGVPQIQVHGFADLNLPDHDIAVSTGTDEANPLATRVAEDLAGAGFDECRAWAQRCGRLEGTTNVQAKAAAAEGAAFVHVELSNRVRTDGGRRADLIGALAGAA
ncbi:hypothetical protein GCM10009557_50790 [Virgisporangium ochraceum]|uniref:Uncharacterized protein n=1 Tax=Virgisporangium ochraceum TaxID=65505 RepID=A0A8J4EAD6_9ACTN|nr:hypothetical protein [Virgisporangium ochraceum]GIJ68170.1 hypothetical protein Voc01_030870 [Virgisporangium ochraceum]